MKFSTTILPLLCATVVSSRSLVLTGPPKESFNPAFKVPGDNPLEFCQNPDLYIGHIETVDLSPNPPQAGQKLLIEASGYLDEDVDEGAKVQLRVKLNRFITLINGVWDLCDNLGKIDEKCPLKKGELNIKREADLPSVIPPGSYEVFANVLNADGKIITCMEATVSFHRG